MGYREDPHETRRMLAECKARVVETTKRFDALNAIQSGAQRSNAQNPFQTLADIATEWASNCGSRMGTVAALFGGELIGYHPNANLIYRQERFGSEIFSDTKRWMQAVRHAVPVDVIEGSILEAYCQIYWKNSHKTSAQRYVVGQIHGGHSEWSCFTFTPVGLSWGSEAQDIPTDCGRGARKVRAILDLTVVGHEINIRTDFDGTPVCVGRGPVHNHRAKQRSSLTSQSGSAHLRFRNGCEIWKRSHRVGQITFFHNIMYVIGD